MKIVEFGAIHFAKMRLEWLRTDACYMRANIEALITGVNHGDYTWEQLGTTPGEIWCIAREYSDTFHGVTGNREWVMYDIISLLHLHAEHHEVVREFQRQLSI